MTEQTTEPLWAPRVRTELVHLVTLPRGWDGYDAEPLSREAAQDALTFLAATLGDAITIPVMTPIHGGIQLEWHGESVDIEIELRPGLWSGVIRESGDEWEGDIRAHEDRLHAALSRVTSSSGA